ncbi:hypothetical protein [Algoriphagus sp. A40]|uniref:hypothetical protein n=1 Tax=Algoriphagus sp. A40 TaxID=1945863 RepID=UPI0009CF290C|nr:hypothetical protein [Algoriphagus sp. A40]OOG78675.1 hypothetical protein B0E43_00925 [Algoriphagus sp. A40]
MDFSTAKKSQVKTTISIPTSLSQTKKLVDDKAKQSEEAKVVSSQEKLEIKPLGSSITLTQELFDLQIFSIQEHFRKADKNLELAILDQPIKVRDGGEVILEVMGHMQEEIAGKMKPDLVGLIRQFTGAERVLITVEVKEEVDNGKPKLYTNTDKLNFLREKHPALAEFQRKFGLEVDF